MGIFARQIIYDDFLKNEDYYFKSNNFNTGLQRVREKL